MQQPAAVARTAIQAKSKRNNKTVFVEEKLENFKNLI